MSPHGALPLAERPSRQDDTLDGVIAKATQDLLAHQAPDGHFVFPLEADATIPAEYVLLMHYLGEIDRPLQVRLASFIRARQGSSGGWPLFHDGSPDVSCSVKAYYALKLAGDPPDAAHMVRARAAILVAGGAEAANVFTRIGLALFGQLPWRAVPSMPVEIMLLPRWFPFHLDKVSYWTRTVLVPLVVLMALKPRARNPQAVGILELFRAPEALGGLRPHNPTGSFVGRLFLVLDGLLKRAEDAWPARMRTRAIARALDFMRLRLNGEDGLGGIFPAMANAAMAFDALGIEAGQPEARTIRQSLAKLLVIEGDFAYCQPCLSPVWDTALAAHALLEAGEAADGPGVSRACQWLAERQVLETHGDWAVARPALRPGGWAFQYRNDFYPDVDDTAAVAMALDRADRGRHGAATARAAEWVLGMQSAGGGWGSFDADNVHTYLNHIPFADHGALLDPPTADVSARCLGFLAQLGEPRAAPAMANAVAYLLRQQEVDGSWFGRWGTNYIYGTWSALAGLIAAGLPRTHPAVGRAVDYLLRMQRADGGWGEDGATYWPDERGLAKASTASQTAWALLALLAAGEAERPETAAGIEFLLRHPRRGGEWIEPWFTAVGFPRVFYLRYHGYRRYFPLWALARYRNSQRGGASRQFGL
ncbi:MAG: squalene--hopene cyclase [Alphaproteobacteria bacterium]|nr:squalene--hopene cyclase [Alphaproteobacteria bacterium]